MTLHFPLGNTVPIFPPALFSAAHHTGPFGEPFERYMFVFRMLAGIYFALLYRLRGFGIAVGTHAFYDILVGVTISTG